MMRLLLLVPLLLMLQACGGGGADLPEEPEPARTIPPLDCKARPELCI